MGANTSPIYTLTPKLGKNTWLPATTANTTSNGTSTIGTSSLLLFTGGTNGSYIEKIRIIPNASTAATATTASVARFYTSTVSSGATTSADTHLFAEQAVPAQTADQATVGINYWDIPCGFAIPANTTILMTMHHAAAANTSWQATVFGGDY